MKNKIQYLIESKYSIKTTKSSTIIAIKTNGIKILREGDISIKILTEFLQKEGYSVCGK